MKKIAVPITQNNQIEAHFGHSQFYEIYTLSKTDDILDLQLIESALGCCCKSNFVNNLTVAGVTCVLCGSIGFRASDVLLNAGIAVFDGCSGNSADAIFQFIDGKIPNSHSSNLDHNFNNKITCTKRCS